MCITPFGVRSRISSDVATAKGNSLLDVPQRLLLTRVGEPPLSRRSLAANDAKLARHAYYFHLTRDLLSFMPAYQFGLGQRGPRTNAREKLTRLSQQQFTELSTDVYDELMRRITNARTGTGKQCLLEDHMRSAILT